MFGFVLVHSQADGLWGCLRSEAIRNKAAMNIHAQVFVGASVFISFRHNLGVELTCHIGGNHV